MGRHFRSLLTRRLWSKYKKKLLTYMWTILYFIIAPTVILHLIPVYIFRFIAFQCKKILRPDLADLVHTRSAVLAQEDWKNNPNWNLVIWLTHKGVLDLDKFRTDFYHEHVNRKDKKGRFLYPEYQQHYSTFWGFLFWKWEANFRMKNHIRAYDGIHSNEEEEIDEDGLVQVIKELTWKPWHPTRSPWEFLQIKNFKEKNGDGVKKSILFFRIHHGLGDGYYILKLLMEDICGVSIKTALGKPTYVKRTLWQKIILGFLFWIRAPYQFVEMLVAANDDNKWHLTDNLKKRPMKAAFTPCIPLADIRDIKNRHNVSFTAVITAAITAGVRNHMIEKGIPIPKEMHTGVAVPMPNHPPKLRNHFIFSFIGMPIDVSNPVQRLKAMDKIYNDLKGSTAPLVNFAKIPLVGALPASWIGPVCRNRLSTCLISNFPGGSQLLDFKGVDVLDMMFNASPGEGSTGLGFCLLSYLDHIGLFTEADPEILGSDEEVRELNRKILNEIELLKNIPFYSIQ